MKGEIMAANALRACGWLPDMDVAARARVASCGFLTAGICKGHLFRSWPSHSGNGGEVQCATVKG